MRAIIAVVVLVACTWITFIGVWTVPACLSSGWGTPGYWGTARSVHDDDGVSGCWWQKVTKERVREQAFEEWARDSERQDQLDRERYRWRR